MEIEIFSPSTLNKMYIFFIDGRGHAVPEGQSVIAIYYSKVILFCYLVFLYKYFFMIAFIIIP